MWSHLLQVGLQLGLVVLALLALSLGPLHWNIFSIGPLNVIAVGKGRGGEGREGFTINLNFLMLLTKVVYYNARSSVVNDLFSIFKIFKIENSNRKFGDTRYTDQSSHTIMTKSYHNLSQFITSDTIDKTMYYVYSNIKSFMIKIKYYYANANATCLLLLINYT